MSVEKIYSTRWHQLTALSAKVGGQTFAERAAFIRSRPSLKNAAVKPKASGKAQAARQRRLRLAEADAALAPAQRAAPLLAPVACESLMLGGSLYDGPEKVRVVSKVGFPRLGCG
jgi:hypothetical protein